MAAKVLKTALAYLAWALDEALDRVPRREDGRWHAYGYWGCSLRLHRWYADVHLPLVSKYPAA